jgi:hypothetical protein
VLTEKHCQILFTSVAEPSALEVELAIEKLESHKSPVIDQILAELIKAGGRTSFRFEMHRGVC